MSHGQIPDHEVLYRRIPPDTNHFQPPNRITSANFKLREGDLGISVYRHVAIDATGVLKKPKAIPGSKVARATVGQIRTLCNGNGEPLNLEVVPADDENDPGHAEIRGPIPGKISSSAANALRKLFKLIELPSMP